MGRRADEGIPRFGLPEASAVGLGGGWDGRGIGAGGGQECPRSGVAFTKEGRHSCLPIRKGSGQECPRSGANCGQKCPRSFGFFGVEVLVDAARGNAFPRSDGAIRRLHAGGGKQHVNVVGHHHPGVQPITGAGEGFEHANQLRPRRWLPQETTAVAGVEPAINGLTELFRVGLAGDGVPRLRVPGQPGCALATPGGEALLGQGIGEAPSHEDRDAALLPMRQAALVNFDFGPRDEAVDIRIRHGRNDEGRTGGAKVQSEGQGRYRAKGGQALLPAGWERMRARVPALRDGERKGGQAHVFTRRATGSGNPGESSVPAGTRSTTGLNRPPSGPAAQAAGKGQTGRVAPVGRESPTEGPARPCDFSERLRLRVSAPSRTDSQVNR